MKKKPAHGPKGRKVGVAWDGITAIFARLRTEKTLQ